MRLILLFILLPIIISCSTNKADKKEVNDGEIELKEDPTIADSAMTDPNSDEHATINNSYIWTNNFNDNQIGYLMIGDNIETSIILLTSDFDVVYDSVIEGDTEIIEYDYFYKVLDKSKEVIFTIHPGYDEEDKEKIRYVKLFATDYISDKGISVGSTASDLKSKYSISEAYFNYNDGLFFFASDFEGVFRFECCHQDWIDFNYEQATIDMIPDSMRVDMIVIRGY